MTNTVSTERYTWTDDQIGTGEGLKIDGVPFDLVPCVAATLAIRQLLADLRERTEERDRTHRKFQAAEVEVARLGAAFERESMCHAACGVIAMANTRESLAKAREIHPDYYSASVQDCIRATEREISQRERAEKAERERDALSTEARKWESAFDAVYDALQSAITETTDSFGAKEELQETAARVLRERDELAARLRAIEGQDPVGWQRQVGDRYMFGIGKPQDGETPLYAAPVAPHPVVLPDVDALALVIARELAKCDGLDPDDQQDTLYSLAWSHGEPLGDVFHIEYLPKGEKIAEACLAEVKRLNWVGE